MIIFNTKSLPISIRAAPTRTNIASSSHRTSRVWYDTTSGASEWRDFEASSSLCIIERVLAKAVDAHEKASTTSNIDIVHEDRRYDVHAGGVTGEERPDVSPPKSIWL